MDVWQVQKRSKGESREQGKEEEQSAISEERQGRGARAGEGRGCDECGGETGKSRESRWQGWEEKIAVSADDVGISQYKKVLL